MYLKRNWNHFSIITGISVTVPLMLTRTICIIIVCSSTLGFRLFSTQLLFSVHLLNSHHRQVDVGGVQLQVDLPVDCSLAVLVEVLSHLGTHGSETPQTNVLLKRTNMTQNCTSHTCVIFTQQVSTNYLLKWSYQIDEPPLQHMTQYIAPDLIFNGKPAGFARLHFVKYIQIISGKSKRRVSAFHNVTVTSNITSKYKVEWSLKWVLYSLRGKKIILIFFIFITMQI